VPDSITDLTRRKIMAASRNECAAPNCNAKLYDILNDTIVGEIAHINGRKPLSARHNPNQNKNERNHFQNLIGLCKYHHKIVDDNPQTYTTETLLNWKHTHELQEGEFHRPFVDSKQVGFARFFKDGNLLSGNWGVFFYSLALTNISDKPDTFESVHLSYNHNGKTYEVDSTIVLTGEVIQQDGTKLPTALMTNPGNQIFLMNWINIRSVLSKNKVVASGGIAKGSAFFLLKIKNKESIKALQSVTLKIRDFSGNTSIHAIELQEQYKKRLDYNFTIQNRKFRNQNNKTEFID